MISSLQKLFSSDRATPLEPELDKNTIADIAKRLFQSSQERLQRACKTEYDTLIDIEASVSRSSSDLASDLDAMSEEEMALPAQELHEDTRAELPLPEDLLDYILSFTEFNDKISNLIRIKPFHNIIENMLVKEVSAFVKKDKRYQDWKFNKMKDFSKVKELHLNFKNLTEIPPSIAILQNLVSLELIGNQLTNLPETIKFLKKLKYINVDYNKFEAIPPVLKEIGNAEIHTRPFAIHQDRILNPALLDDTDNKTSSVAKKICRY